MDIKYNYHKPESKLKRVLISIDILTEKIFLLKQDKISLTLSISKTEMEI